MLKKSLEFKIMSRLEIFLIKKQETNTQQGEMIEKHQTSVSSRIQYSVSITCVYKI